MTWNAGRVFAIVLLGAGLCHAAEDGQPHPLAGNWLGSIQVGGAEQRMVLKLQADEKGQLSGTAGNPDRQAREVPLTDIRLTAGLVQFTVPAAHGAYSGRMSGDGAQIDGTWSQAGQTTPMLLKRVDRIAEAHTEEPKPQEPKKPYPYVEEEVSYENVEAGVLLSGTFTKPAEGGPFPAVLLISGSGPQDRDARVFGHPLYLLLADQLTRAGLAVLRVDDRGVGRSTGSFATATTADFAADAQAGVKFLKARKDVDPRRIGLYGHSEGGLIAPIVAARSKDMAFVVLVAAPGIAMEQGLPRQAELIERANGTDEEVIVRRVSLWRKCLAVLKEEADPNRAEQRLREAVATERDGTASSGQTSAIMEKQIPRMLTPWFRYALTLDPRPALRKVQCPVLAVNGERDTQVPPENLARVRAALEEGGNKNILTVTLPGLNHLLQTCRTGSPREYGALPETLAPAAFEVIASWLKEQTKL